MAVKVYKVNLLVENGKHMLDVRDNNAAIPVDRGVATTLIWYLDFTGAPQGVTGGTFNAIDLGSATSGFRWQSTPANGIFDTPVLVGTVKQAITLTDNATTSTPTDFIYQLNATITNSDGSTAQYQTGLTPSHETMNDPTIRNT